MPGNNIKDLKIKEALIGKTGWCQDEVTEVGGALKCVKTVLVVVFFYRSQVQTQEFAKFMLRSLHKYVLSADRGETHCWIPGCPKSTQVTFDAYLIKVFTRHLESAQYGQVCTLENVQEKVLSSPPVHGTSSLNISDEIFLNSKWDKSAKIWKMCYWKYENIS